MIDELSQDMLREEIAVVQCAIDALLNVRWYLGMIKEKLKDPRIEMLTDIMINIGVQDSDLEIIARKMLERIDKS